MNTTTDYMNGLEARLKACEANCERLRELADKWATDACVESDRADAAEARVKELEGSANKVWHGDCEYVRADEYDRLRNAIIEHENFVRSINPNPCKGDLRLYAVLGLPNDRLDHHENESNP